MYTPLFAGFFCSASGKSPSGKCELRAFVGSWSIAATTSAPMMSRSVPTAGAQPLFVGKTCGHRGGDGPLFDGNTLHDLEFDTAIFHGACTGPAGGFFPYRATSLIAALWEAVPFVGQAASLGPRRRRWWL